MSRRVPQPTATSKALSWRQRAVLGTAVKNGGSYDTRALRTAFALCDRGLLTHEGRSSRIACGAAFRLTTAGREVAQTLAEEQGVSR